MFKKLISSRSTFYCFTPAVSLGTFLIEFILAIYVAGRYKMTKFNRLAITLLLLLGLFQFSEYMMCKTDQMQFWGEIGITAITLLPAFGLHLITIMTRKSRLVPAGYFLAALIILSVHNMPFLNDFHCTDKFVVLQYNNPQDIIYTIYYFGFLLIGLTRMIQHIYRQKKHVNGLVWMMIGYLSFILPTAFIYVFSRITFYAIPSIMCGFALIFAFILVFKVIPEFNKSSKELKK